MEETMPRVGFPYFRMILLCALSLSLGWGIRGNFGHEAGAMIPGTLAAMAAVLMSGRQDWWQRVAYFAMFGAIGWGFGGSISYMHVIAYTHSGHLPSQAYGFACLFVIGFTWGALGGAGTALPACLDRDRLTAVFPPLLTVFGFWLLGDILILRIKQLITRGEAQVLNKWNCDIHLKTTCIGTPDISITVNGLISRCHCYRLRFDQIVDRVVK